MSHIDIINVCYLCIKLKQHIYLPVAHEQVDYSAQMLTVTLEGK